MSKKGYKSVPWLFGKDIEIPEEWDLENLTNLDVKTSSGGTPSRENSDYYTGKNLWIKSGELKDQFLSNSEEKITDNAIENSSAKIFPKNTVLVAMYGATIGKTAILEEVATTNQAICGILPNKKFNPVFLQQFLIQKRNILVSFGMGGGQPNISQEVIKNFKYLVPTLKEQQKIATILSNVDNLIDSTSKIIKNSKSLKTGLMQKLLTRGLGHTKFKKVPWLFGKEIEIPEEWEVRKCSKILELKHGYQFRDEDFIKGKKGIKIIKIGNLKQNGSIDSDNCDIISLDRKSDFLNIVINSGDVLMALTGATLGKMILVPKINEILLQNYRVGNFLPKNDVDKNFMYYVLKNILTQKQIWFLVNSGAQPNIGKEDFNKIKIICPSLPEQQKIASILSNIDAKIDSQTQYKEKLEKLKKSLMQKLLTGEVRV